MLELETWTNAARSASKDMRGKNPIFEDTSSCRGRHAARTKAMPDAVPIRRAC